MSKWVPLESNPEVFNAWSQPLGLPSKLAFQDLYSLDPDFLQYTPQPVHAVLLLFPTRGKIQEQRKKDEEDGKGNWEDGNGVEKKVWWIKQTIGNACGSIGLLHALLNLPPGSLSPTSTLTQFYNTTLPLSKADRANELETTDFFTKAHTEAAKAGQSSVPITEEELDTDLHFIAFVKAKGKDGKDHIVELDGSREGPFDRGHCTDFLTDVAKVVQEKYMDLAEGDVRMNLMVLAAKGDEN